MLVLHQQKERESVLFFPFFGGFVLIDRIGEHINSSAVVDLLDEIRCHRCVEVVFQKEAGITLQHRASGKLV